MFCLIVFVFFVCNMYGMNMKICKNENDLNLNSNVSGLYVRGVYDSYIYIYIFK